MTEHEIKEGLTFDDVLLTPSYSEIMPNEVEVSTYLTRAIRLHIPILSAAMDTVTEAKTAICLAQEGGIGIIHRNMSVEEQAQEPCQTTGAIQAVLPRDRRQTRLTISTLACGPRGL